MIGFRIEELFVSKYSAPAELGSLRYIGLIKIYTNKSHLLRNGLRNNGIESDKPKDQPY